MEGASANHKSRITNIFSYSVVRVKAELASDVASAVEIPG